MPSFFSENDKPLGKPMNHWVIKWWQSQHYMNWRRKISPVLFLQGTQQSSTDLHFKSYEMRAKPILLSPINYLSESGREDAKREMDIVDPHSTISVILDGEPLNNWFRADSGDFFNLLGKRVFSDGYW